MFTPPRAKSQADQSTQKEIKSLNSGTVLEMKLDAMADWIIHCEREGVALTHMSGNNGVHKRSEDADAPEILQGIGK